MRLKSVWIEEYKNLKDFSIDFQEQSNVEMIAGLNGSGKSNFFEALLLVFYRIYSCDDFGPFFEFALSYVKGETEHKVKTFIDKKKGPQILIDGQPIMPKHFAMLPSSVLVYYSGHNVEIGIFVKKLSAITADKDRYGLRSKIISIDYEGKDIFAAIHKIITFENIAPSKSFHQQILRNEVRLEFRRPQMWIGDKQHDVTDKLKDRFWRPGKFLRPLLKRLDKCLSKTPVWLTRQEGHTEEDDLQNGAYERCVAYYDTELLKKEYISKRNSSVLDFVHALARLKEVGILYSIQIGEFDKSDGEMQSVFLDIITKAFASNNSLIILDEPDAFMHPTWQYALVNKLGAIHDSSHIVVSTHSPVTLTQYDAAKINYFELKDGIAKKCFIPKNVAIKKLSEDIIRYSEQHGILNTICSIQSTKKPVLFTEGSTDPVILRCAWERLYDEEISFLPYFAFNCGYVRNLLQDDRVHSEMGGLPVFGLFDFDSAYNDFNALEGAPLDGGAITAKKIKNRNAYAILVPIPPEKEIEDQVYIDKATDKTFEDRSCCAIEHAFFATCREHFQNQKAPGNGNIWKFTGEKTKFANDIVPSLPSEAFEIFRPMFEFIRSKCEQA